MTGGVVEAELCPRREAEHRHRRERGVAPEHARQVGTEAQLLALGQVGAGFPRQRVGRSTAQPPQGKDRDRARHGEQAEGELVLSAEREHRGHQQRAGDSAGLVERLVQAEGAATPDAGRCVREHRVARWCAYGLADPLAVVEQPGSGEIAGDSDQRHAYRRHQVAHQGLRPRACAAVGQSSREHTQHQGRGLSGAGDHADHEG